MNIAQPTEEPTLPGTLICFEPSLVRFKFLCNRWYLNHLNSTNLTVWSRFPLFADFYVYCTKVLRFYIHLSFTERFGHTGFRSESKNKLIGTVGAVYLPPYILDMIREIARPMYTNLGIEIQAFMPLTNDDADQGIGIVPGLGWNSRENEISALVSIQVPNAVLVIEERLGRAAIYTSTHKHFCYANGSQMPQSRLMSITYLRHVGVHAQWQLADRRINTTPGTGVHYTPPRMNIVGMPEYVEFIEDVRVDDVRMSEDDTTIIRDAQNLEVYLYKLYRNSVVTTELCEQIRLDVEGVEFDFNPPVVHTAFHYGLVTEHRLHAFLRAMSLNDIELEEPLVARSVMTLGLAFTYPHHPIPLFIEERFPSNAAPSKIGLEHDMGIPDPGKPKTTRAKKSNKKGTKPTAAAEPPPPAAGGGPG